MGVIRVAIVGAGNCASSLVQGLQYYQHVRAEDPPPPGIMHSSIGGYSIGDIRVVAAFDVNVTKVGRPLSEAIFAAPNNTIRFADAPDHCRDVIVARGMTHDGIGEYLKDVVIKAPGSTADIHSILTHPQVDVLINYLPVGSEEATRWYVEQALAANVGVINCIPVFIASADYWHQRFVNAGLPILGDDIKSQVGATIVHRALAELFRERGVHLDRTMQLNVGGNTDFLNMLERSRLVSKKISKTQAVTSIIGHEMDPDNVHVGPSDHVPWLQDRKWAYIRLEGTAFGGVPLNAELKLEVHDSPNSAGIVIDAIRCIKVARDRKLSGAINIPSAYFFKSPPNQTDDSVARIALEKWIDNA